MGFPTRVSRDAFGPIPEDSKPVVNPKRALSAKIGNLMMWQLAGAGLMVPTARMVFTVTAGVLALVEHSEAFQPNGGDPPTVDRTSAGVYTFGYLTEYPNEEGEAKPLAFGWGGVLCMGTVFRHGIVELNPSTIAGTVRIWDNAAAAQDCARFVVFLG